MRNVRMGLAWCVLLVGPGAAWAGGSTTAPVVQASMIVTGNIAITPDGNVASYQLDHADKIAAGAKAELARVIPQWKFEPVNHDGKAVRVQSPMSVRLVAKPAGDGKYAITIASARFGGANLPDASMTLRYARNDHRVAPHYPRAADRAAGIAYVLLEVGRDGKVQHVAVEKVNLYTRGNPAQMQRWRRAFGAASIDAARQWKFDVPTTGPEAVHDHWFAQTAVRFNVRRAAYGSWQAYLPGSRQYIPWADQDVLAKRSADAIPADGELHSTQQALHLLSSLGGH